MFVSHRNLIVRIYRPYDLFVSICDIYCSIHIIELLLLMMYLNKYFQQQKQQHIYILLFIKLLIYYNILFIKFKLNFFKKKLK